MTDALTNTAVEMADIFDIEPVLVSPHAHWIRVGLAVSAAIAVAALLFALFRYVKKRRAAKAVVLSPFERALKELEALRKSRHYAQRDWAPFYFILSETFKRFVTDHCGIDILDRTTDEILKLRSDFTGIADEAFWERMKAFLTRGDQVKFAKAAASPAQASEDFEFVEKFVRVAKPKPPAAAPGGG